jgi:hypothetical protein
MIKAHVICAYLGFNTVAIQRHHPIGIPSLIMEIEGIKHTHLYLVLHNALTKQFYVQNVISDLSPCCYIQYLWESVVTVKRLVLRL